MATTPSFRSTPSRTRSTDRHPPRGHEREEIEDGAAQEGDAGARPETAFPGPIERWGRLVGDDDARTIETERGQWPGFYRSVADSLRSGEPPPVQPREAVAVLQIIEAAFESARTGAVVVAG